MVFINFIAAGDFDESNLSTIGSANKRGNSKALLSVGNKVLSRTYPGIHGR